MRLLEELRLSREPRPPFGGGAFGFILLAVSILGACAGDGDGCTAAFSDPEFAGQGRDAIYYVRAIEARSLAVGADPLGCTRDAEGRCIQVDSCSARAVDDDCLAETEERAWSSPIFVDAKEG